MIGDPLTRDDVIRAQQRIVAIARALDDEKEAATSPMERLPMELTRGTYESLLLVLGELLGENTDRLTPRAVRERLGIQVHE